MKEREALRELVDALNTVKMTEPMCDYWDEMMATPEGKRLEAAITAALHDDEDDKKGRIWSIHVYRCSSSINGKKIFVGEFPFEITQANVGLRLAIWRDASTHVIRGTDIRDCVVIGGTEYLVERHESGTPTVTIQYGNPWRPPSREDRLTEALRQISMKTACGTWMSAIHKIADDAIGGD